MKKLIINVILTIIAIIPVTALAASTSDATEPITGTSGSLNIEYKYEDYKINNIDVDIYYVASVSEDYQYSLSGQFASYSVVLNGIKTTEELKNLEETIGSYISADKIEATNSGKVVNNKISFKDLKTGLYYVKTQEIDEKDYKLSFESFLISVPSLDDNNKWNYDVKAFPKPYVFELKYEDITYTVIKEWRDNKDNRPKEIAIEIFKDGEIFEEVALSSDNNWTYKWDTIDDGSKWTVIEKVVPSGYTVSINKNDNKFIIINTGEEENPQTVDNIYLYFYILVGGIVGMVASLISYAKMREN